MSLYLIAWDFRSSDDRQCSRHCTLEACSPRHALALALRLMPDFARRRLTRVLVYAHNTQPGPLVPLVDVSREPDPIWTARLRRRPRHPLRDRHAARKGINA
jgi:hypothetical protein